jgi:hypothetical protein
MTKFLKPAEGRTVHQETGEPWPLAGMDALDTLFTRRRLIDGDLIEADPAASPEAIDTEPAAEKAAAAKRGK